MDLVKKASSILGKVITVVNEEEAMEEVLNIISRKPAIQVANWFMNGIKALPEGTTLADLIECYDANEDILDEALDIEELFTEEELAELRKKFGKGGAEPE